MIITDGVHVVSTESLEELHEWAERNEIRRRRWFHGVRKGHPHYDLPSTRKFLVHDFECKGQLRSSREVLLAAKAIHARRLHE